MGDKVVQKTDPKPETWSIKRIVIILFIALVFVYTAQQLGLLAKIGINLGPVQFELQGVQANAAPQTANGSNASPNVNNSAPGTVVSSSTQCPQRANWFTLPYAYTWYPAVSTYVYYEPFGRFWTWDYQHGYVHYDYSNANPIPRNQWILLNPTNLNICVDMNGNVLAALN